MSLVLLKSFQSLIEAEIVKGKLEANGIECFLQNENVSRMIAPISEVKLMILQKDLEKAKQILIDEA